MNLETVIHFFKEQNLYDEEYFKLIEKNTKVYNKPYEEIKEFIGCYPTYNEDGNIVDFKLILPKIKTIDDILIYIHEYSHALFMDDEHEIFPNIMESLFINRCCCQETKQQIINRTLQEIETSSENKHKIGKKIKIMRIK